MLPKLFNVGPMRLSTCLSKVRRPLCLLRREVYCFLATTPGPLPDVILLACSMICYGFGDYYVRMMCWFDHHFLEVQKQKQADMGHIKHREHVT